MDANELRALADALSVPHRELATVDVIRAAAYLRACADAKPVAWRVRTLGQQPGPWRAYWSELRPCVLNPSQCEFESLYTRPAPAVPQAEPKREPLSDWRIGELYRQWLAESGTTTITDLMRSVERAHEIGGSDAGTD